jgi:hypothetical protein
MHVEVSKGLVSNESTKKNCTPKHMNPFHSIIINHTTAFITIYIQQKCHNRRKEENNTIFLDLISEK